MQITPSVIIFPKVSVYTSPKIIFVVFLLIVLAFSVVGYKKDRYSPWFDYVLLLLTGIMGLFLLILWVGSLHQVLSQNLNIMWASPLNIALAVGLLMRRKSDWFRKLVLICCMIQLVFIPVSFLVTQHFPCVAYLMDGIVLIRCVRIYVKINF